MWKTCEKCGVGWDPRLQQGCDRCAVVKQECKWCKQSRTALTDDGECGTCWVMRDWVQHNIAAALRMVVNDPDLPIDVTAVLTNPPTTDTIGS
jgi:hypothetical protein